MSDSINNTGDDAQVTKATWGGPFAAIATLLFATTVTVTLILGKTDSPPSVEDLQEQVVEMYQGIADGNYSDAYDMRSERCKESLSRSEYASGMHDLFAPGGIYYGRDLLKDGGPKVEIRKVGDDAAMVTVVYTDRKPSSAETKPRRWTVEDGEWRFDNCDT